MLTKLDVIIEFKKGFCHNRAGLAQASPVELRPLAEFAL